MHLATTKARARAVHSVGLWAAITATTACGAGTTGEPSGGPDAGGNALSELTYAPCELNERVGEFRVDLTDSYTGIQGKVQDGVVPGNVPELVQTVGECRLYTARVLFCDPACGSDATCGDNGTCVPYPASHSVGTVTVGGLMEAVEMTSTAPGHFYTNSGSLPHPGFATGAHIKLSASGGDYEAFELGGFGVAALEVDHESVRVERGLPLTLDWTPASSDDPTMVTLSLNVSRHGGNPIWIDCDVADTGSYTIAGDLITTIYDAGLSGFPSVIMSRRSADSISLAPGCVEFRVASEVEIPVEIPGLVSCSDDTPCLPLGQTCQVDLTCG